MVAGRFGVFASGGVGEQFSDIDWGDLLPAGGSGLRFKLTKPNHINFPITSPHFSQDFYCGGADGHVYCVALRRAPRRTVEYVCGALGRAG